MKRLAFLLVALIATLGQPAAAQRLSGTVRDSISGVPVPGAVVVVLDRAGTALARSIAGELGRYSIVLGAEGNRLQVMRLGFRPRLIPLPQPAAGNAQLDILMASIPSLLERVRVTASASCPRRPDREDAAALFAQAKAGLLATVVARESNPATVIRVGFDRMLDANGDRIVSQRVRVEESDRATVSFNASRTGMDFVQRGFRDDSTGVQTYFGPDADVLLDDNFARAYCFNIAKPDPARASQIGLGFVPLQRRKGRVDVEGALWIDTVARTLKGIEFRYVGLDQLAEGLESGGKISFNEIAKAIVLVDRWSLRLVGAADTTSADAKNAPARRLYTIREIGGELARATWPDGRTWAAPLGIAHLTAVNDKGATAPGTIVRLLGTDYVAKADTNGVAEIPFLVPGPYAVEVIDPRLAQVGVTLATPLTFVAARDSTHVAKLEVPTADSYVADACRVTGRVSGSTWLVARVTDTDGQGVGGARWKLSKSAGAGWLPIADGGKTGSTGLLHFCRNLSIGETLQLEVRPLIGPPATKVTYLKDPLTILSVQVTSQVAAARRDPAAARGAMSMTGVVTDSISGAAVQEASVALVGTDLDGITDSTGHFTIAGVTKGRYTVEVRTPALDSLGAVHQARVVFSDSAKIVELHVPSVNAIAAAMCGVARDGSPRGVVVGRVAMRGDSVLPRNVGVVAQWQDAKPAGSAGAARSRWITTRADETGTYRLCGVPTSAPLVLRTEVDSATNAGAAPVEILIAPDRQIVRADITMNRGAGRVGAFAGVVFVDSAQTPVPDVEVVFPDLNKSVLTDELGRFRVDDIPIGSQKVIMRRIGYGPVAAQVDFFANRTTEHRVELSRVSTVAAVTVTETEGNKTFEANRKLGLGHFLTREELSKLEGQTLSGAIGNIPGIGITNAAGGQGFVVGKRAPANIPPSMAKGSDGVSRPCGTKGLAACPITAEGLADKGIYCPSGAEQWQGMSCACYAQVYIDGRLMNNQRPTEPYDINRIAVSEIAGVELYASAAQTPSQYSALNAVCGVVVIWTRRSH